jgi:pyruvate/2-oxoglutarate dehydrogenase complex dihydrolipoamide dehydrogenase (E3) component
VTEGHGRSPALPSTFDAIVVGLGVGGEAVAGDLAEAGWSVLGIDHHLVGGECPYWGCIPSKMAIRAANLLAEGRRIAEMAGRSTVAPDWAPVARRIRDEATDDWDDRVAVERFEGKGGTFLRGDARIVAPDSVEVAGARYAATRALVIGTGGDPALPPIPGLDTIAAWTNREALEAKELPASLVVIGGGAIGCELAQAFARFGVEVTVIEVRRRLLAVETVAACDLLAEVFAREGITVINGLEVTRVAPEGPDGSRVAVELSNDTRVVAAQLLVATGRRSDLDGLGVAALGVDGLDGSARALPVDENLRVAPPGDGRVGVWGVGDVTGKGAFTHVATYQARIAVADILGRPHEPADYKALPRVTFTDPEIGAVGLTPEQARERGIDVRIGSTQVPTTSRGWIHGAGNDGFIELVEDRSRGVLVGATSAGPWGGEVLGLLALAVHAEIPVEQLRTMIYAYPTFHRGVEDALRSLA